MHHTQEREQKIRLWLDMWLRREDLGIDELQVRAWLPPLQF